MARVRVGQQQRRHPPDDPPIGDVDALATLELHRSLPGPGGWPAFAALSALGGVAARGEPGRGWNMLPGLPLPSQFSRFTRDVREAPMPTSSVVCRCRSAWNVSTATGTG